MKTLQFKKGGGGVRKNLISAVTDLGVITGLKGDTAQIQNFLQSFWAQLQH